MRIAGLVLAAGRSSRMAPLNKLLEPIGGEKMVRRAAATALAGGATPVIVVTGHEAASVAAALRGLDVTIVANPDYADGLSTSLCAGLRTLPQGIDGALILLGDMAIIFTLVKVIAQSEQWDLPSGRLLDAVLSSCQFEHSSREGVDVDHMICPTRLGASEFPQVLKDAVVASEDERFYSHGAIDHPATLRAAWHFSLGDRQGGSTITQQLARSILLKKEDSLERKLMRTLFTG